MKIHLIFLIFICLDKKLLVQHLSINRLIEFSTTGNYGNFWEKMKHVNYFFSYSEGYPRVEIYHPKDYSQWETNQTPAITCMHSDLKNLFTISIDKRASDKYIISVNDQRSVYELLETIPHPAMEGNIKTY